MTHFVERRSWNNARVCLIIGPGGAGKSSLGLELAPLLHRRLVDLDQEFRSQFGDISTYMRDEGYERYKLQNSELAVALAAEAAAPIVLVASSGFLTNDNPAPALIANQHLLMAGYGICLLPSRCLEVAVSTIVSRQTSRSFGRSPDIEEAVIRARYRTYASLGDLLVFSTAPAKDAAKAIADHLSRGQYGRG